MISSSSTVVRVESESAIKDVARRVRMSAERHIFVDLEAIEKIGSPMVSSLLKLENSLSSRGRRLAICNASPIVQAVLQMHSNRQLEFYRIVRHLGE